MTNPRKPQAIINVEPGAPGFIGCSYLAGALGFSEYNTPLQIHDRFMGIKEEVSPEQQAIFDRGHRAEQFIADEISAEYGYKLRKVNGAYVHPNFNWWICHPDRMMVGKVEGKRIGVEIKSSSVFVNSRWGEADTDEVPIDYYFQCLGYMACGVCDEVHLFRCSNWKLTRYVIKYDEERLAQLDKEVSKEVTKWLQGTKPEPITLQEAYKTWSNPEEDKFADDYDIALSELLKQLQSDKKDIDEKIDKAKVELINRLGGKSRLINEKGKALHTYRKMTRTSIDSKLLKEELPEVFDKYSKESEYYTFR